VEKVKEIRALRRSGNLPRLQPDSDSVAAAKQEIATIK
jgi:hypothetical protein